MIITRNGKTPVIHPSAVIAASAQIIGDVSIGEECYIDHNVVIESSGAPIVIGDRAIIFPNSVARSTGGSYRPPFPLRIGHDTLISPLCSIVGCEIGSNCYIATNVLIFQGATVGDGSRVSAGAIVHANSVLPASSHVGLRHIAVPTEGDALVTSDLLEARRALARADFFGTVFGERETDQLNLHQSVIDMVRKEVLSWVDSETAS